MAHLGDLKVTPTQSEIESLGTVNVVLVPRFVCLLARRPDCVAAEDAALRALRP